MARHYEFINAALVALVAIVGMVFYFNAGGGALGAFHESKGPWLTGESEKYYQLGLDQAGPSCIFNLDKGNSDEEWKRCCQVQCKDACNSLGFNPNLKEYFFKANPFETCGKACVNGCDVSIRSKYSIGFNYRGVRTSPSQ